MTTWTWVLVAVGLAVILIAAGLWVARQRSRGLRDRFGPEYDRAVESGDSRRKAETALADRAKRRDRLEIAPLAEESRLRYSHQWRDIQEQFVDAPSVAVQAAGALLTEVMETRGYPVSDFDEQADLVSVDHPDIVEDYRIAHDIHTRTSAGRSGIDDQREALLRYRSLFEALLQPAPSRADHDARPEESETFAASDARHRGDHR